MCHLQLGSRKGCWIQNSRLDTKHVGYKDVMIQKIYMPQMCGTCSFPVFQNGHCDGDDDDYDDGDDDDTLSVRKATGDTDVCHLYFLEDDDDEYDDYDDDG